MKHKFVRIASLLALSLCGLSGSSAFATSDLCVAPDKDHDWSIGDVNNCFPRWCKMDIRSVQDPTIHAFVNTILGVKSFLQNNNGGDFDCETLTSNRTALVSLDLSYSNLKALDNVYTKKMTGPMTRLEPLMYFPNVYRYQLIGNQVTDITPLWKNWNPHINETNKDDPAVSNNDFHKNLTAKLTSNPDSQPSHIVDQSTGSLDSYLGYLDISMNKIDMKSQDNVEALKNLNQTLNLDDGDSYKHQFSDGNWCQESKTGDTCTDPQ